MIIRRVVPTSARAGERIALLGTNLPLSGALHFGEATIDVTSPSVVFVSREVIEVYVPAGKPGTLQIVISGADVPFRRLPSQAHVEAVESERPWAMSWTRASFGEWLAVLARRWWAEGMDAVRV